MHATIRTTLCLAVSLLLVPRGVRAAAGGLDPIFGSGGVVTTAFDCGGADVAYALAVQSDGKLVAAGLTTPCEGGGEIFALARYKTDGSLDPSFGSGGKVTTDLRGGDIAYALAVQSDGKLVAAGISAIISPLTGLPEQEFALARYNTDGSPDLSFGSGGKVTTDVGGYYGAGEGTALAVQSDGKLVVAGWRYLVQQNDIVLARYNTDGSLDSTFGSGHCSASQATCDLENPCPPPASCGGVVVTVISGFIDEAHAVAVQSDGKLVAAGVSRPSRDDPERFALIRYNTNGSLDPSFGSGGVVTTAVGADDSAYALAIQSDGKLVAAGLSYLDDSTADFALVRYKADGSLDPTFGGGGKVTTAVGGSANNYLHALAVQSDGKLVAAGRSEFNFALARYNGNGPLDAGFGSGGALATMLDGHTKTEAYALAVQADGKLVAGGNSFGDIDAFSVFTLARYLGTSCADGIVDAGEPCDDGAAGGTATSCCTANCQYVTAGTACTGGTCDATGTCVSPTTTTTSTTETTTSSPEATTSTSTTKETSTTTETTSSTETTTTTATTSTASTATTTTTSTTRPTSIMTSTTTTTVRPTMSSSSTTVTTSSSTTTTTIHSLGCLTDLGETILDTCTGLEWEKKNGVDPGKLPGGGTIDYANPHDVDNVYLWAGWCVVSPFVCQANAAAAATCLAHADGVGVDSSQRCKNGCRVGCNVTGAGPVPNPTGTVWDWINQLNATNFAGHNDWRLPSEAGRNGPPLPCSTCNPRELETILLAPFPCSTRPCIDPIFGPTSIVWNYWSSSGANPLSGVGYAWTVSMKDGNVDTHTPIVIESVRAVRDAGGAVTTTSTSTSSSTTTFSTSSSVTSSTSSSSTTSSMSSTSTTRSSTTSTTSATTASTTTSIAPATTTTTTTTVPCTRPRCTIDAGLTSPACAGQTIPASVTKKFEQAANLIEQAATSPSKKAKQLLSRAKKTLKQTKAKATRAAKGKNPKISAACAAALRDAADGVVGGLGV